MPRSAYTDFVARFMRAHKGKAAPQQMMKMAAASWRAHKGAGGSGIASGGSFASIGGRVRRRRRVGRGWFDKVLSVGHALAPVGKALLPLGIDLLKKKLGAGVRRRRVGAGMRRRRRTRRGRGAFGQVLGSLLPF